MQSEDGRILILQVVIDDTKLVCANIYAPKDPGAQHRFYLHLNNILQKFSCESIILGGDFNCPLDLEDVWRKLHSNNKQFTWRTSDQKIKCRLDYWLTSKHYFYNNLSRVNAK